MAGCTNGPIWTAYSINGPGFTPQDVVVYNNLYIVGGQNSSVATANIQYSSDGSSWTTVTLPGEYGGSYVTKLIAGNGILFAQINYDYHAISSDGINWTRESHYFGGPPAGSTAFGGGYFFMTGGVNYRSLVYSSTALSGSWSFTDNPEGYELYMNRNVIYGGGMYVTIGSSGFGYTNNLATPITIVPYSSGTANQAAYGNGAFVVIGGSTVYRSTDGINWTTFSNVLPLTGNWDDVIFSQGNFLVCRRDDNRLAYSTDGITWTLTSNDSLFDSASNVGQMYLGSDGSEKYIAANQFDTNIQVGSCIPVIEYSMRLSNVSMRLSDVRINLSS